MINKLTKGELSYLKSKYPNKDINILLSYQIVEAIQEYRKHKKMIFD